MCIRTYISTFLSSENNFPSHRDRSRSGMEQHLEDCGYFNTICRQLLIHQGEKGLGKEGVVPRNPGVIAYGFI